MESFTGSSTHGLSSFATRWASATVERCRWMVAGFLPAPRHASTKAATVSGLAGSGEAPRGSQNPKKGVFTTLDQKS